MITWTNNSTTNDNRWSVGDTAEWYVTGELPDWVTGDLSDVKPMFVFSQEPELTARGDTLVGSGTVSYNSTTSTLTISENIGIDLNNWTVQIQQPNGTGKLRWPSWGAVSAKWADPGCHAWDANDGDLTHEITRVIELSGESGWTETAFTGSEGGIWRVSYDLPVQGTTATTSTSRIVTLPAAVGARPNVLERFTLGGEGGYAWNTYIYQCFDKVFTRAQPWTYKDPFFARHTQYTDSNGTTYWVNHRVLRSCVGNNNQTCLYRDGWIASKAGNFQLNWIPNNLDDIQDIFMPSSYQSTYNQILLMNDGRLLQFPIARIESADASEREDEITTIRGVTTSGDTVSLNNVTAILAINQSHNEDCLVKTDDNRVWHVGGRTASITARQIPDIDTDKIMFCQLGDNWDSAYVVYQDRPTELYRMTFEDGTARDLDTFKWINGVEVCPNTLITLDVDEQFVHGCSNEFHAGFMTNKRILSYKCNNVSRNAYNPSSGDRFVDFSHNSNNIFFLGACAYSMAISIDDIPYLMSRAGYNGMSGYLSGKSSDQFYDPLNRTDPMCDYDSLAIELRKLHELGMLDSFDSSISSANQIGSRTYADFQTTDSRFAVNQYTCVNSLSAGTAYNNTAGQTDCLEPEPTQEVGNWASDTPTARNGSVGADGNHFMYVQNDQRWNHTTGTQEMGYYLQMPCEDRTMPAHSSMEITHVSGTFTWEQARLDALERGGQLAVVRYTSQQQLISNLNQSGWLGGVRVEYRQGSRNDGDIDGGTINGRHYWWWTDSTTPASIVETSSMTPRAQLTLIQTSGHQSGTVQDSVPEDSPCVVS